MVVAFNLILIGLIVLIIGGNSFLLTEFLSTRKYWSNHYYWLIVITLTFLMFGVSITLVTLLFFLNVTTLKLIEEYEDIERNVNRS